MLPLALIAMAGVIAAAVKLTGGPNLARVAAGLRLPLPYVQSAAKWSSKRGVPLEWTLATILVESSGNPQAAGDSDGRSKGLMQVNAVAHAAELRAAGLSANDLYKPDTNIAWGTKYLAQFRSDILNALGGRAPPAPLDEIVRLSYKGPTPVLAALRHFSNPEELSWAPSALANWRKAMGRVTALTRGRLVA